MNQQNNGTSVKVLAYSASLETHDKLLTLLVRFPRIIEPEVLRHRSLSFSAASSRAMNASGHIKKVTEDMFIPKFTKEQKGMSAKEYLDEKEQDYASLSWQIAGSTALIKSKKLVQLGVHKQHATRLLQPFEYQEMIITGTNWESFFELRCPKYYIPGYENDYYRSLVDVIRMTDKYDLKGFDSEKHNASSAQPEIQHLAERMWDIYNLSVPKTGGIHLPFGYNETLSLEDNLARNVAQCARISYLSEVDDIEKDKTLYNKLKAEHHWSPFEHICFPMSLHEWSLFSTSVFYKDKEGKQMVRTDSGLCKNFRGFIPLRFIEENNLDFNKYGNT